jgi:hypothetical protein
MALSISANLIKDEEFFTPSTGSTCIVTGFGATLTSDQLLGRHLTQSSAGTTPYS